MTDREDELTEQGAELVRHQILLVELARKSAESTARTAKATERIADALEQFAGTSREGASASTTCEPNGLTDGERMVWAAAFVIATAQGDRETDASSEACRVVMRLRRARVAWAISPETSEAVMLNEVLR